MLAEGIMLTTAVIEGEATRTQKPILLGMIGNILDHYDTALYGFSAPLIAPLIFPNESVVAGLIMTYGLMSTSIITRPLGAWFFGFFAARRGAKSSLVFSLTGLAVVTCSMGLLPTYAQIGEIAPCLLALLRLLQGFFGAGESTIAPFFLLQNTATKRRGLIDSIYGSTTVMGELFASFAVVMVIRSLAPDFYWRIPFLLSALTAGVAIFLRVQVIEHLAKTSKEMTPRNFLQQAFRQRKNFLRVIFVSGMSYITYSVPFVFFNSFVPVITTITYEQMMTLNTSLLAFDMIASPLFGWLSDRVTHAKFMATMALSLACFSLPLFFLLDRADIFLVSTIRIVIVVIGIAFCAPLHAWFMTQIHGPARFALVGIGYSIGSEIFGRSAPAICWLLWNATHTSLAPGMYVMIVALLAGGALIRSSC